MDPNYARAAFKPAFASRWLDRAPVFAIAVHDSALLGIRFAVVRAVVGRAFAAVRGISIHRLSKLQS